MNVTRSFLNNMISKKDADLAVGEAMKQGANEGVVFANVYAKCRSLLKKNALVKIKGKKDNDTSCLILEVA